MKWDCDKKQREAKQRLNDYITASKQWHDVFAWFPKRVGPGDCRWLEVIQRRVHWHEDRYHAWTPEIAWVEYRSKEKTDEYSAPMA